ncbi:MAG: hypothetical protein DI598_08835 [Pseudopedobacter saltans]|uniref:DUF4293 domain-containing protein n=1 Tax=Pseudopedobacter saltans TaxID=151895 RepID=A0A2W5F2M2_9SPHI|nr:MAG: hypothetical protein DI598_08835 [Pseudopedobacter saltans]
MIQRIQSVWLLLAAIFAILSINQTFFMGSELGQPATFLKGSSDMFILVMTIVLAAVSFIAIFMFKNRNKQIWMVVFALVLSIFLIVIYLMKIKDLLGNISLTSIFVFIIPIFLLFAIRGIARDKKLIKSVDRLRG